MSTREHGKSLRAWVWCPDKWVGINTHKINSGILSLLLSPNFVWALYSWPPHSQAPCVDPLGNAPLLCGFMVVIQLFPEPHIILLIPDFLVRWSSCSRVSLTFWLLVSRFIFCLKWYAELGLYVNTCNYLWRQYLSFIVLSRRLMTPQKQ